MINTVTRFDTLCNTKSVVRVSQKYPLTLNLNFCNIANKNIFPGGSLIFGYQNTFPFAYNYNEGYGSHLKTPDINTIEIPYLTLKVLIK